VTTARTVTIPHLGRVEGHGGITVRIAGDRIEDVNMDIHEGSRYYEALLKGKHFLEVQGIITRVCAICSANHTVAALNALENALGIEQSERIHKLRGLLLLGSMIESHSLHVFALALPDFLGHDSIISMAKDHPHEVAFALRLKQLGNRIQDAIGGRAVHPINTLVGGFGTIPTAETLRTIRSELEEALEPLMDLVDLVAGLDVPDWAAEPSIHVALRPYEDAYRLRGVAICTSRGDEFPITDYRDVVREFTVEHSHAKHAALASGESYMVGAMSRLTLWGHFLGGRAPHRLRAPVRRRGGATTSCSTTGPSWWNSSTPWSAPWSCASCSPPCPGQPARCSSIRSARGVASPPSRSRGAPCSMSTSWMRTDWWCRPTSSPPPPRTWPTPSATCASPSSACSPRTASSTIAN
jgi:coenzyme F420-reducing hydrogenase alpha subunit